MEKIKDAITPDSSHVLVAPHHGRKSGRVPKDWLDAIDPKIIVVGEAPASEFTYYDGWDTITQNSAGDIVFECLSGKRHVRWSRFFGQVVKVDSRTEQEAPRWPGRDGGSRRSSRHG